MICTNNSIVYWPPRGEAGALFSNEVRFSKEYSPPAAHYHEVYALATTGCVTFTIHIGMNVVDANALRFPLATFSLHVPTEVAPPSTSRISFLITPRRDGAEF